MENEPAAKDELRKLEPNYREPYVVRKVLSNDSYLLEDIPGSQITNKKFGSVYGSDKMKACCRNCSKLSWIGDDLGLRAAMSRHLNTALTILTHHR